MVIRLNKTGLLLKTAFKKWRQQEPLQMSAVIAYNAIFSLPGLLVLVITFAGYLFNAEVVNGELHKQITKAMGVDTADAIQQMIIMADKSTDTFWASLLALITIVIGAAGVFVALQKSLNKIWEVKATVKKAGILQFIKIRLFSYGLMVSIAFLLLMSLVVSSLLSALGTWVQQYWSPSLLIVFEIFNFLFSLTIITLLFAMMFKLIPDAKIKWDFVWLGAFITALLFVIGKTALGLYFGKTNPGSGYGAAGSVILILLWTSYSSMIVFFGAEVTRAYSDLYFGETAPTKIAVKKETLPK